MKATYVCSIPGKLEDAGNALGLVQGAVAKWGGLGAGRGNVENWWIGPSPYGSDDLAKDGYCGLYFNGDMDEQERKAWIRGLQKVVWIHRKESLPDS